MGIVGGVVMRILPREPEPAVFAVANESPDQCIGCHAVSANGSRMVAEVHAGGGVLEGPSRSFDLKAAGGGVNPTPIRSDLPRAGFSGVYPDGSLYVTTGRTTEGVGTGQSLTGGPGNITGTFGAEEAKLFDMATGAEIASSGVHPYAYMPTFQSTGRRSCSTRWTRRYTDTHSRSWTSIAPAIASRPTRRYTDPARFPSWPFFLPDVVVDAQENTVPSGKRVLFALNSNADFLTGAVNFGGTRRAPTCGGSTSTRAWRRSLDRANGLDACGQGLPALRRRTTRTRTSFPP